MNKEKWLELAEIFDSFRIIPRLILACVVVGAGVYISQITIWYMGLPSAERTAQVSAFMGVTVPAVFGIAGKITDWYLKTGRSWNNKKED